MPGLLCRDAARRDIPVLAEFQLALADETEDLKLDHPTVLAGVTAILDRPERGRYFVAEREGRVVGGMLVTVEWSDWRNGEIWWLQSVYVRPDARRQGVFRSLHAHVREIIGSQPDVHGLRLYVHTANQRAQATYAALGMSAGHYVVCEWMKRF